MERLYGIKWDHNQQLRKTGYRKDVDILLTKCGGPTELFDVSSYDEWWKLASRRISSSNGGGAGDPFYFGENWASRSIVIRTV
jgi:hypothetical protein